MGGKMSMDDKKTLVLLEETGLSSEEVKKRYKLFMKTYPSGNIKKAEFYLIMKNSNDKALSNATHQEIDHLFRIYDSDGSGSIDFFEFELAVHLFNKVKSPEESIRFIFRCLDLDASGVLEKKELLLPYRRIFRVS